LQRITWQWRLNQRISKSGAVRADDETPDASASGLIPTLGMLLEGYDTGGSHSKALPRQHLLQSPTPSSLPVANPNPTKARLTGKTQLRKASFPYQLLITLRRLRASQLLALRSLALAPETGLRLRCEALESSKYHRRIALFQFFSHLPTLSVLPSELLNPNRASLQAGREPRTPTTVLCKKSPGSGD
jgi:hypothetical protein